GSQYGPDETWFIRAKGEPIMREAVPAKQRATAARDERSGKGQRHQVYVNFYRRMKPYRVYPLTVRIRQAAEDRQATDTAPVVLRPFIPGAQVIPVKYELDANHPEVEAAFYVTPLVRGRLPNARLEVYCEGSRIQEIALPMKGARQLLTWILLGLTFLVPA